MESSPHNHAVCRQSYVMEQFDAGTRHEYEGVFGRDIFVFGITFLVDRCCTNANADKGVDPVSLPEVVVAGYAIGLSAVGL